MRTRSVWAWSSASESSKPVDLTYQIPVVGTFSYSARYQSRHGLRYRKVTLPSWFVLASILAYPCTALILGPLRRWHRRRKGLCLNCRYNLTGLTVPRCPECGTEFDFASLPTEAGVGTDKC